MEKDINMTCVKNLYFVKNTRLVRFKNDKMRSTDTSLAVSNGNDHSMCYRVRHLQNRFKPHSYLIDINEGFNVMLLLYI